MLGCVGLCCGMLCCVRPWGEEQEYPYAHQYASEHNTYIYDVNNDNEYNQYHYPEKSYFDESWESEWDNYPLYNYGSQPPKEKACC